MLYKFINENLIEGSSLVIRRVTDGEEYLISNPETAYLKENGWKEFVNSDYPETEEGYIRKPYYADEGDTIVKKWTDPIAITSKETTTDSE